MNEIEIFEEALSEYKKAHRLKQLNELLSIHLHDSIYYLIKYSEKYDFPLPNKKNLLRMIENADYVIDQIVYQDPSLRRGVDSRFTDPEPIKES
jgi:hypothetical protein